MEFDPVSFMAQIGIKGAEKRKQEMNAQQLAFMDAARMSMIQKNLNDNPKPSPITYNIPGAVDEYSKYVSNLSREGLTGENVIRDQMGAAYAGAQSGVNRAADSSAGALGAMSGLYGKYVNSVRDLGVQSAQMKAQNEQNYNMQNANAALTRADYADKAWEYNVNMPYQRGMNAYESAQNAAMQNLFNGMDSNISRQIDYSNYQQSQANNWMNQMPYMNFGTGGSGTPTIPNTTYPTGGGYGSNPWRSTNPNNSF